MRVKSWRVVRADGRSVAGVCILLAPSIVQFFNCARQGPDVVRLLGILGILLSWRPPAEKNGPVGLKLFIVYKFGL